jgi:hypothetical protein
MASNGEMNVKKGKTVEMHIGSNREKLVQISKIFII